MKEQKANLNNIPTYCIETQWMENSKEAQESRKREQDFYEQQYQQMMKQTKQKKRHRNTKMLKS